MLPEMCTHISWAEKVIRVSQEIRIGSHPPLPAPAQTTPDSSGCMIKCPGELNQLEICAFFPGLFSSWKISQPTLLGEHRGVCMELDAVQAAGLILTAAVAFGSLVLCVRGDEGCSSVLGLAVPPLAAGHLLLLDTTHPLLQESQEN